MIDIFAFLSLLGGLALFLYGVSMMGGSLERTALGRARQVLNKITGTPLRGVLLGGLVTAAVQSSSAATVMTAELVGAGAIPLRQAVGVILGANIGTTVTAHLLSFQESRGLLRVFSPAALAPVSVFLGAVFYLGAKKGQTRALGQLLLGFGVLFTGMLQMEAAVAPLGRSPAFLRLFRTAENPLLGVLAGAGATAVIQSSSASVGILQAAASTGAVQWGQAAPILLGQNIGTCVTPFLASIGGSRGAKQAALVHLLLNLLGTAVFLAAIYGTGWFSRWAFWGKAVSKRDIAWFHTFFNVAVTAMFLPFAGAMETAVRRLIPDEN